ncbi:MAG: hypothetical protein LBU17_12450 [Treponema sp.]|nr:hypothetical protein [Treponema sp.]
MIVFVVGTAACMGPVSHPRKSPGPDSTPPLEILPAPVPPGYPEDPDNKVSGRPEDISVIGNPESTQVPEGNKVPPDGPEDIRVIGSTGGTQVAGGGKDTVRPEDTGTTRRPEIPPNTPIPERIWLQNRAYIQDKLGPQGDTPWFSEVRADKGFLYFIALSGKAASEQRARDRARDEARELLREYTRDISGQEPGPTVGRGIEPVEWNIIEEMTSDGKRYIACLLARVLYTEE